LSFFPTYHPRLADLIDATAIPGDLGALEGLANQGIDFLLGNLRYSDLIIEKSPEGNTAFYSLTVLSKELSMPVPGLGMEIIFFNGQKSGYSSFPISFDWRWPIQRYLSGFESQGFSHAPEAFIDILLNLADIEDEKEFISSIIGVFLSDGTATYTDFLSSLKQKIADFKQGEPPGSALVVNAYDDILATIGEPSSGGNPATGLIKAVDNILADPANSLFDLIQAPDAFPDLAPLITTVTTAYETLIDEAETEIDFFKTFIEAALADVSDLEEKFEQLITLFRTWLGNITREDIEHLLIPQFKAGLTDINVALAFPRKWLVPLDTTTLEPLPDPAVSKLTFNVGSLEYSTETGFHFLGENDFDFTTSMIGKTGLTIGFSNMKLDLSRQTNIAEADADGRPVDFMGVYAEEAFIGLPKKWFKQENGATMAIIGRNLLIGTGGISGTIGLEAIGGGTDSELVYTLGKDDGTSNRKGFAIGFSHFHMKWQQNSLIESSVKGSLTVPGFKRCDRNGDPVPEGEELRIDVEGLFEQDGDFQITAKPKDGLSFQIPSTFIVTVDSLEVGKDDGDVYIETSGQLSFAKNPLLNTILKDPIEVKKLRIYTDGSFEIERGSIPLPDGARLKLGPTEVYITNLTLGAADRELGGVVRKYKNIGFSCGVSAGTAGLDLRGDGIEFWFTTDDDPGAGRNHHSFMRIAGIGIDLIIPASAGPENAAVIINGYLSMKEEEYLGSVKIKLPKANIAGGATMRMKPKMPAWAIDAFLEMSVPIPLGPSGLGIYGFRGLFGYRYIATKQAAGLSAEDDWFDYYKVDMPPDGKGLHLGKMQTPDESSGAKTPISIGAGLSLATATDQGKTFSLQAFLLISLPELILIQGKANILGERIGMLEGDAPFFAMVAFSPGNSVEFGLGADFKQRDDGALLDIKAEVRSAYYFKDSSAWFAHFGTKEKPITARILSMFNAYSYLEISARGIEAGAGVSFGFDKKYGPVKAAVRAYIDIWGNLSFEGAQIGAGLAVGGNVDVTVWGVGFGISIATILEATVPRPFRIAGSVEVCVYVKLLVKKFEKCIDVDFVWHRSSAHETAAISPFPESLSAIEPSPVSALHRGSGKTYVIDYFGSAQPSPLQVGKVIPLDSYIDMQSKKSFQPSFDPALPVPKIGGINAAARGHEDVIPPKPSYNDLKHSYKIKDVAIQVAQGSSWVDYHPYSALSESATLPGSSVNPDDVQIGFFQSMEKAKYNKIRLLSSTPFSYTDTASGTYIPEQMGLTSSTLYCEETRREWNCINWTKNRDYPENIWSLHREVSVYLKEANGKVVDFANVYRIPRSLHIGKDGSVEFTLPKASIAVKMKLFSFAHSVHIAFYKADRNKSPTEFIKLGETVTTARDWVLPITYESPADPIDKVIITPAVGDPERIRRLELEIDRTQEQFYLCQAQNDKQSPSEQEGKVGNCAKLNTELLRLQSRLDAEKARGCYWAQRPEILAGNLEEALENLKEKLNEKTEQLDAINAEREEACEDCGRDCEDHCFIPPNLSVLQDCLRELEKSKSVIAPHKDSSTRGTRANHPAITAASVQARHAISSAQQALVARKNIIGRQSVQNDASIQLSTGYDYAADNQTSALEETSGPETKTLIEDILMHIEMCEAEISQKLADLSARLKEEKYYRQQKCDTLTELAEELGTECEDLNDRIDDLEGFIEPGETYKPPEDIQDCGIYIHELCWLTEEDFIFNQSIPSQAAIEADFSQMKDAIEKIIDPVWRPDETYLIRLSVSDTVSGVGETDFDIFYGFRTSGPIGHYPENYIRGKEELGIGSTSSTFDNKLETPETSLKFYIDEKRSYPYGKIIGQKPLYYKNPKLLLFFTQTYVSHFFDGWPAYNGLPSKTGHMEIVIKDPVEGGLSPQQHQREAAVLTQLPITQTNWAVDDDPIIPDDVALVSALRNPEINNPNFPGALCWESGGDPIVPASKNIAITVEHLKPLKLYSAIVKNHYEGVEKDVHNYTFQTSKFANLEDHINSYHLKDDNGNSRDAVFTNEVDLQQHGQTPGKNLNDALKIVRNSPTLTNPHIKTLTEIYSDPFQKFIEGHFKMLALHPPLGVEFNYLKDKDTNRVFAILIKSIEPLNDPRIPFGALRSSISVFENDILNADYVPLFSKDRSQVILMNSQKSITAANIRIRFSYLEWDGKNYAERSSIMTDNLET